MADPTVAAIGLDHLVLHCADIDASLAWYIDRLGLAPVRVDEWRAGMAPFPSLRVDATTIIDLIPGDTPAGRLDHLCFVVRATDLAALVASGAFTVLDGPVPRFGAQGTGTSVYVADPDGTTVELRHYE
ncbi:MAG: VOC family protein [Actinomycetota bacterium]|nr:VOC family protein [Actinomycetota bacterium]